jgi:hypothetical protein
MAGGDGVGEGAPPPFPSLLFGEGYVEMVGMRVEASESLVFPETIWAVLTEGPKTGRIAGGPILNK